MVCVVIATYNYYSYLLLTYTYTYTYILILILTYCLNRQLLNCKNEDRRMVVICTELAVL